MEFNTVQTEDKPIQLKTQMYNLTFRVSIEVSNNKPISLLPNKPQIVR